MSVFGAYASFYDTLYREKDYEGECDFIEAVLQHYGTVPTRRILDLGCGTGGHLLILARRGYEMAGVDRSEAMLAQAQEKLAREGLEATLQAGDVQAVELEARFDAVISMFAVFSYLLSQETLLRALRSAQRHLHPGGLFLFDVWFGAGVLNDPPTERCKIIQEGEERLFRLARPEMDLLQQTVTVHYKVLRLRGDRLLSEIDESHTMRYLFPQEIVYLLDAAGFELLELCPFLQLGQRPGPREWSVSVIARRRDG